MFEGWVKIETFGDHEGFKNKTEQERKRGQKIKKKIEIETDR